MRRRVITINELRQDLSRSQPWDGERISVNTSPDTKKRAAIATAARHVMAQPDTEITEVIEKDEDRNVAFGDRCAAAAAMFFGAITGLAIILLAIIGISAKAGGGAMVILTFHGYGLEVAMAAIGLFTAGAFLRPGLTFRLFGHVMKPFNELFRAL